MTNVVKYISPSSFYYWEKCPLIAVYSKIYSSQQFFPRHPDADLGSIIHQFYEKQNEWGINSIKLFNQKWEEKINELNDLYKKNELQKRYYPVQWHSKYYTVKKLSLSNTLLSKKTHQLSKSNIVFEKWINDDVLGGYVDLMVVEKDKIKQITDFKTGDIYENNKGEKKVKEVYRTQLALYVSIILNKQQSLPVLYIEDIKGDSHIVEMGENYISEVKNRAIELKRKIDFAVSNNDLNSLAIPNEENCKYCNNRIVCYTYADKLINTKIDSNIDLLGKVIKVNITEIHIEVNSRLYRVKNVKTDKIIEIGSSISIYNLYYPDEETDILYFLDNTIIRDE